MRKFVAPTALVAGLIGLAGGIAYAQSQSGQPEQSRVQFVQPAAQTVEPSPTTTAAPSPTATVAPKPVESTTSATSAPKVVQKKVTVAETPAAPAAESTTSTQTSKPAESTPAATPIPGQPLSIGTGNAPTGYFDGHSTGTSSPAPSN